MRKMLAVTGALVGVAAALALALQPVAAQPAPDVRVGDAVVDMAGNPVGSIRSVDDGAAVVWTGTMKVTLGLSSFRNTAKGLRIGMTREQLEQAATRVQARGDDEVRAALVPGAQVRGADGAVVATVESLEGDMVVLAVEKAKVRFPLTALSRGKDGPRIGMTAGEFQAAVQAQMPKPETKKAKAESADAPEEG